VSVRRVDGWPSHYTWAERYPGRLAQLYSAQQTFHRFQAAFRSRCIRCPGRGCRTPELPAPVPAAVDPSFCARFRLRAHTLRVETSCWQIHNRLCNKCDLRDVQDKKHVLFLCPCLEMCYFRRRFEEQFADFAGRTYIGDTGDFCFDNIGAEDVELFLLKQTNKSFPFSL